MSRLPTVGTEEGRVLLSTHDLERAGALRDELEEDGYTVELVTPAEDITGAEDATLLVLSGGALTEEADDLVRQARRELGITVLGYQDEGTVPDAARASDYLELFEPSTPEDEAALVIRTQVERRRLQAITGIVGETEAMREVLERVVQIAPVDATVLVTGESGTGKELVARGLHALSRRRHKPFIAVNVAALSETLLESELFGHEKGAFTGAVDSRKGLFELAHKGTIFLDEIGEMPLATQTKLLRILEQREFLRVGGESSISVDVRIVTATNQDLRQLVAIGEFRRDLYFRLNVLRIELPPLRERVEDIPRLVRAFVKEAAEKHDRSRVEISDEAMEILKAHHWPGNVRELRNLVESMVVLSFGREIRPQDIPPEVRGTSPGRALVPTQAPRPPARTDEDGSALHPQLEFIFRTLVELRMDMDDLRKEFEAYRSDEERRAPGREIRVPGIEEGAPVVEVSARREDARQEAVEELRDGVGERGAESGEPGAERRPGEAAEAGEGAGAEEGGAVPEAGTVVFRPGMTMEELEREAIAAALREVGGNRRRAAEMLGIGERTLYRKIRKYELEDVGQDA